MDMFTIVSHVATATAHYQEIYRQRTLSLLAGWDGQGTTQHVTNVLDHAQRLAEVNTEETYKEKLPGDLSLKVSGNQIAVYSGLPCPSNILLRIDINGQTPKIPDITQAMAKERRLVNPELED